MSTDFLTDLGFEVPASLDAYVPKGGSQAYVPTERIAVMNDGDYLIWATEKPSDVRELEKIPGFTGLRAVKNGTSLYTDAVLAGAIYFASPLSLPYVLDKLVPLLNAGS